VKRLAALLVAATFACPAFADDAAEGPLPAGIVARYLLRDVNGRAVTEGDFAGRFQLITFGYTYCPDICPTTLVEMADILKRLGDAAAQLQAIFITVDPERDTPQVLKTYTAHFDPRIIGLSGSPELVKSAAQRFKVRYEKVREPGAAPDQYAVDHSAGMYLLGPNGGFAQKFAYGMPAADVAERIRSHMTLQAPRRR
jgi:protein SCO1/2